MKEYRKVKWDGPNGRTRFYILFREEGSDENWESRSDNYEYEPNADTLIASLKEEEELKNTPIPRILEKRVVAIQRFRVDPKSTLTDEELLKEAGDSNNCGNPLGGMERLYDTEQDDWKIVHVSSEELVKLESS
jgi:hypothetical protein